MNDRGHSSGEVLLAFLVGGLIGAGVALVTAPYSGRETRDKLREAAGDAKDKIRTLSDETREKVRGYAADAKDKLHETYEHGKGYVDEKKSVVTSAIEAGKKAMKEEKERLAAEG